MYGEMVGYSVVALSYLAKGLDTLVVNDEKALQDLELNPQVLAEAIQIAGRVLGVSDPYAKLKAMTRGKKGMTIEDMRSALKSVIVDKSMQERLLALTPAKYIGDAPNQARQSAKNYNNMKSSLAGRGDILTLQKIKNGV